MIMNYAIPLQAMHTPYTNPLPSIHPSIHPVSSIFPTTPKTPHTIFKSYLFLMLKETRVVACIKYSHNCGIAIIKEKKRKEMKDEEDAEGKNAATRQSYDIQGKLEKRYSRIRGSQPSRKKGPRISMFKKEDTLNGYPKPHSNHRLPNPRQRNISGPAHRPLNDTSAASPAH
jgi:hypothetical protein